MPQPDETPNPVTTSTEPAVMSPLTRWTRTVLQVVAALIIAVPTAAAAAGVSATLAARAVGVMGAFVIVVSAVQNVLNSRAAR